jgi:hypothetical protein
MLSQSCPNNNNLAHTKSYPTMTNPIMIYDDPTKQSISCPIGALPALPPIPSTMSSTWHSTNCLVTPSPQNSITHQTGFNIRSTLKKYATTLPIPSLKNNHQVQEAYGGPSFERSLGPCYVQIITPPCPRERRCHGWHQYYFLSHT